MTDVIIATAIGGAAALTLYGICCLLDAFIEIQTGEDVRLEDVPPTRQQTWDMTEVMAQTYRDEQDKVYQR